MDNHVSNRIAQASRRVGACVIGTITACALSAPPAGAVAYAAEEDVLTATQQAAASVGGDERAFAASQSAQGAQADDAGAAEPHVTLAEEPFEALPADAFPYSDEAASEQSDCGLASSGRTLAYDQSLIDRLGIQNGAWSGACLGYAAAYCQIITTGQYHTWGEFDFNGGYDENNFYGRNMTEEFDCWNYYDQQSTLRSLYDAINAGHPCILYVTTTSGSQHWVAIIGYENVDDANNLSPSNFIMLDSNYAFDCRPCSLTARGYQLRFGDTFGNVRVSKGSASTVEQREPYLFSDCYKGDWFVDSGVLEYAFNNGLMTGFSGTTLFKPWDCITRGQVVSVLHRLCGEPDALGDVADFSDVDYGVYYGRAIRWARQTGVVSGYENQNIFRPDQQVSREELACMIANYAEKIAHLDISTSYEAFWDMPDAGSVSTWARQSVSWCIDKGIIHGVSRGGGEYVAPSEGAWRASMASMVTVLHRDYL